MPLWICDFENCSKSAVRTLGDCVLCNRHLCSNHLQPGHHSCPRWPEDSEAYLPVAQEAEEHELTTLIAKVDTRALEARASCLRQGMPCSIPPLKYDRATQSSVMGGMNYHIEARFSDGVSWVARIRRFNARSPPPALQDYIIRSEVATLGFLQKTNIPTPQVFDFALEQPDNPVGVGYILMEKLPGSPLIWSLASPEQRKLVMSQIADMFIELEKHPFPDLGSLDRPGESHIGPFAHQSPTNFETSEMRTTGPFSSAMEYRVSEIQLILDLIVRKEMYTEQAVDAYLIHKFLLDLVPLVVPSPQQSDTFYLKHGEDKGDHILIDEDYKITGIIDWEWSHTAPSSHAFNSPIGFLPVGDFFDSKNCLGDDEVVFARLLEERGRHDLAYHVWNGRLQHSFSFCCGYNPEAWDGFIGLFRGLREALGVDWDLEWNEWKSRALQRYKDDTGLQQLLCGGECHAGKV